LTSAPIGCGNDCAKFYKTMDACKKACGL